MKYKSKNSKALTVLTGLLLCSTSLSSCFIFDLVDNALNSSSTPETIYDDGSYKGTFRPSYNTSSKDVVTRIDNTKNVSYLTMSENKFSYKRSGYYDRKYLSETANKVLVVPVNFTDVKTGSFAYSGMLSPFNNAQKLIKNCNAVFENLTANNCNNLRKIFGDKYYDEQVPSNDIAYPDLTSFYQQSSYGKLNLDVTVTDVFTPAPTLEKLIREGGDTKIVAKIGEAMYSKFFLQSNAKYKLSDFDGNNDGKIDSVWFIYNIPDYATIMQSEIELSSYSGHIQQLLWAFSSYFSTNKELNNHFGSYGWASTSFIYPKLTNYSIDSLDLTNYKLDSHTLIHETGHMLGLDDYYDYDAGLTSYRSPAGSVLMMDHNIQDHDPYSKFLLNWGEQYVVTNPGTIQLKPFQDHGQSIIIPFSYDFEGSPLDDYIILEYYTPTKLNKIDSETPYDYVPGINDYGIRAFHVDSRVTKITNRTSYYLNEFYYPSEMKAAFNSVTNTDYYDIYRSNTPSFALGDTESLEVPLLEALSSKTETPTYSYYNNLSSIILTDTKFPQYKATDLFKVGDSLSKVSGRKRNLSSISNSKRKPLFTFTVDEISSDKSTITLTFEKVK